jgi:hypothetical protein
MEGVHESIQGLIGQVISSIMLVTYKIASHFFMLILSIKQFFSVRFIASFTVNEKMNAFMI